MNFQVSLPEWATRKISQLPTHLPSSEQQMRAVIEFSRLNFEQQTGGPFAAGVFEKESGRLVVIGVNRVMPSTMSSAHAEIVAISLAQKIVGCYDLGGPGIPDHQLVVNGRPCAMCFGSIPWSGIRSLVVGANGKQIEELTGFDEGPIHPEWQTELRRRDIEVTEDILAEEACQVLRDFSTSGQPVYNGRLGGSGQKKTP